MAGSQHHRRSGWLARTALLVSTLAACALLPLPALAGSSAIGDHGHFLYSAPTVYANNPDGRAFEVTYHRMMWTMPGLARGTYRLEVRCPDGEVVAEGDLPGDRPRETLRVPSGEGGVYRIDFQRAGYGLTWIQTTLPQTVVYAGDWEMADGELDTFILHAMAPRRWWFYVPEGTETFEVRHTVLRRQSHRENYGFFVMNPRGQRVTAFFGGRPRGVDGRRVRIPKPITERIETDPGTTGRFWSIWTTGGDSHNFSDLQIMLDGVPPYFAPTPEQWFNPESGKAPPRLVYDESQVRIATRRGTNYYPWAPAPFLGDEGYNGFRGRATLHLLNPEGRAIDVGVSTYLVPDERPLTAVLRAYAPGGSDQPIADARGSYASGRNVELAIPASGKGIYRIEVDAPAWYFWHEPATPVVIAGQPTDSGGARFQFDIGIARHWYFKVPRGTERFKVAAEVADPDHALVTEVHAPDRMVELLHTRGGAPRQAWVDVPEGLDGHIWFLRTEVGSATRLISDDPDRPRQMRIAADIELQGVPGYLAPTWEQWFNPDSRD